MSVIGKNIVWLLISQLATWVISLLVLVVVPDYLDADGFGSLNFAISYVGFFALAAGLGAATFLAKEVARDHGVVGPYVYNAVLMKVVMVAVLSVAAFWLAVLLGNSGETLVLIGLGCVGMLFSVLSEILTAALSGMERMVKPAMWIAVQVYVQSGLGLLVLFLGWGVVAYGAVLAFSAAIPMVACSVMLWPMVRGHRRFDLGVWKLLVAGGAPLLVLTTFNLIYGTIDVPILHRLSGSEAVGWYVLAYRWVGTPIFIATAVVQAYFPSFSAHGANLSEKFVPLVNRAVQLVLFVSVPAAVGIWLVADDLIHLFYTSEFENSILLMRILVIHVPLAAMDTILALALIAADRLKRYVVVAGIAAVLNPIAFTIAIKVTENAFDNGAIGAAIVTVGTEVFIMVGALLLKPPGVLDRATLRSLLPILAASAAMIPVVLLADSLSMFVAVALGAVTYGIAAVAFGAVSVADLRNVGGQIGQVVGRGRSTIDPTGVPGGVPLGDVQVELDLIDDEPVGYPRPDGPRSGDD